jgi:hypothetical protein
MKRFFTLAALFISIASFAAAPPRAASIVINNGNNSQIQVRLNGRTYNVNQQTILLNNLAGGRHQLEIYKTEKKPFGFNKSKPVLIYSSAVYVDASFIVDVNISRSGKVSIGKSLPARNSGDRYRNADSDRYNDNRYDDANKGRNAGSDGYDDRNRYPDNNKQGDKIPDYNGNGNRPDRPKF